MFGTALSLPKLLVMPILLFFSDASIIVSNYTHLVFVISPALYASFFLFLDPCDSFCNFPSDFPSPDPGARLCVSQGPRNQEHSVEQLPLPITDWCSPQAQSNGLIASLVPGPISQSTAIPGALTQLQSIELP